MKRAIIALVLVAALGAGAYLLLVPTGTAPKAGPRAVHLGEEECAECHMIVSDPHFAAQRVLGPEDVKVYDDHGCLLEALTQDRSGTVYFAEVDTGAWIRGDEVRFERTTRPTPMGYGLAARHVANAAPGSMDLDAAIRAVTAKEKMR